MVAFSTSYLYHDQRVVAVHCTIPLPPPFTLNRIDDRFVGWEKLCTRHTPGEISLGAETGPGALVSNTKWITPPLYQEKRRETSVAALTI